MKIILALFSTLVLLTCVAAFNYTVDPMCYYHCETFDPTKPTMNTFYNVGQKVVSYPDTELILLGSSRGQMFSPLWVQKKTGLKTLNLSIGGGEAVAKIAFLNLALEKLNIKQVVWLADYFEIIPEVADVKIKSTPILRHYVAGEITPPSPFTQLQTLIDHNTFEAAIFKLQRKSRVEIDHGSGSFLDDDLCDSESFKGNHSFEEMKKEAGVTYDSFTKKVLKPPQSDTLFKALAKKLAELGARKIETSVVILPYNPMFHSRMIQEYPNSEKLHLQWITKMEGLRGPYIKVYNFYDGVPGDDGSEKYWDDGVHLTCKGSMAILKNLF